MTRAPSPDPAKPEGVGVLWAVIAAVVFFAYLVSQCSDPSGEMNYAELTDAANEDMGNAIAAQESPPVAPLNEAGIRRGVAHLRLAFAAQGFSGAMVYSQNCFDALTREFSWAKLDQCGGFDMLAARSIEDTDTEALGSEAAWFQSEAAAGRYLAAATGAGQPASEADVRLSELQTQVAGSRLVRAPAPIVDDVAEDPAGSNEGEEAAVLANLAEEALVGE